MIRHHSYILKYLRKSFISKAFLSLAGMGLFAQVLIPATAFALTSGPAQEEFASFEPAETSEMVDLYSGDMVYNLPVLSVPGPNGGYPINLAYHSGIGMDQEASWVGLGWNINVGAVNRQLRGLPDDFKGEEIEQEMHLRNDWTVGLDIPYTPRTELFGIPQPNIAPPNLMLYYNSYRGMGFKASGSFPLTKAGSSLGGSLGWNLDTQNGIDLSPSIGFGESFGKISANFRLGTSINSRRGTNGFSFTSSINRPLKSRTNRINRGSYNGSSTITMNPDFYVPSVSIPMKGFRFDFDLKLGGTAPLFGWFNYAFPSAWNGYYEQTKVANDGIANTDSYGYMNLESSGEEDLQDFQRKEIPLNNGVTNLSPSYPTYDLYSISGQGTGGMFRPYRSDVGVWNTANQESRTSGARVNGEFGASAFSIAFISLVNTHIGVGGSGTRGSNYSGAWIDDLNQLKTTVNSFTPLEYSKKKEAGSLYEPYAFKMYGDKVADLITDNGETQLDAWGGETPVRVELGTEGSYLNKRFTATQTIQNRAATPSAVTVDFANDLSHDLGDDNRQERSTQIIKYTKAEAELYGLTKDYKYYEGTVAPANLKNKFDWQTSAMDDHISEIQVLQTEGTRYIYGLPAYNHTQVEASFSVDGEAPGADAELKKEGLVEIPANDPPYSDHYNEYYSKRTIPSYVHSWMLTGVVGQDYVDRTGDGITDDDYGYWVKFEYVRKHDDYQWRTPYKQANYVENNEATTRDDIGSYTYGTKDVYYLHTIRTKTHTAVFETSDRPDGLEAEGEDTRTSTNNFRGDATTSQLDRMQLFTNVEYEKYTAGTNDEVPLKTVNFEYSNSLCKGVHNNNSIDPEAGTSGKLTLDKVYFTYNNSARGELSPYTFEYGDQDDRDENPYYNLKNLDRWGNFKRNMEYNTSTDKWEDVLGGDYPFYNFPYTVQDDYDNDGDVDDDDVELRNKHAAAWSLKKITLPTGGVIEIEYEQDDYAYVEDEPSMQMYDIRGVAAADLTGTSTERGGTVQTKNLEGDELRIYFDLAEPMPAGLASEADYIRDTYIKDITHVAYKVQISVPEDGTASAEEEYLSGYVEIDPCATCFGITDGNGTDDVGFFTLQSEGVTSSVFQVELGSIHPFTKAGYNYLQVQAPELLHEATIPKDGAMAQITQVFPALIGFVTTDVPMLLAGSEAYFRTRGFCDEIFLNGRSIVRLHDPDAVKHGGGVRVSQLTLSDEWEEMGPDGSNNTKYGQVYDYTTEMVDPTDGSPVLDANGNPRTMSSGVAYEPRVGAEENATRKPIIYTNSLFLKADRTLFLEEPLFEDLYPGQSVGYSKVTVSSFRDHDAQAETPAEETNAPTSTYEFYTPRDFPVIAKQTEVSPESKISRVLPLPGFATFVKKRQAKSQGYTVIINDMAGKQKAKTVRTAATANKQPNLISKEEYIYKTRNPYDKVGVNELDNQVQVLTSDQKYRLATVGQSHDIFIDAHQNRYRSETIGVDMNVDISILTVGPFTIPMIAPIPSFNYTDIENSAKTIVTNKIIYKTGILEKTRITDISAELTTENMAFDAATGQPLLTRIKNEYKDDVYSYSYPAHWFYEGMGPAFNNWGYDFGSETVDANGKINFTTTGESDNFAVGDELWVRPNAAAEYKAYVIDVGNNYIQCIKEDGKLLTNGQSLDGFTIIRSGLRNLQSLNAGAMSFKDDASTTFDFDEDATTATSMFTGTPEKVINASAVEFKNEWQTTCLPDVTVEGLEPVGTVCQNTDIFNLFNQSLDPLIAKKEFPALIDVYVACANSVSGCDPPNNCPSLYVHHNVLSIGPDIIGENYNCPFNTTYGLDPSSFSISGVCPNITATHFSQNAHSIWIKNDCGYDCELEISLVDGGETFEFGDLQSISTNIIPIDESVGEHYRAQTTAKINGITDPVDIYIEFKNNCLPIYKCVEVLEPTITCASSEYSNPFINGAKGIWRPFKSYAYNENRRYTDGNISDEGYLDDFMLFSWTAPSVNNDEHWVASSEVTKVHPQGFEVENVDAVGIYSSALYGYNNSLVTAVAANARYSEIMADGFEDYKDYDPAELDCGVGHASFYNENVFSENLISSDFAHSGKYSYKLTTGLALNRAVLASNYCATYDAAETEHIEGEGYKLNTCDCVGSLGLVKDKEYIVSGWFKTTNSENYVPVVYPSVASDVTIGFTGGVCGIHFENSSGVVTSNTFHPTGATIEGWQQMEGRFTVPSDAVMMYMYVYDESGETNVNVYVDDLRIQPFNAQMKTFVYHPETLRLMAELDNYNLATFYQYDDEGNLTKIKKETTDGIKMIKESRQHTVLQPPTP